MPQIYFPRALLREKTLSWNPLGVAATPGVTMDSTSTYVRTDGGGFWSCVMSDVSLSGPGKGRERQRLSTLLWRAVRQVCDGGVNNIVVPRNDALFIPYPPGIARAVTVPHSDGSSFSDGTSHYQAMIDIVCDGGADLRATSMAIDIRLAAELVGGESFSVRHPTVGWRLYEIATVVYADDDHAHATITFGPPLREAVGDGEQLEFDRPCCTMRLAKPESMNLSVQPWTFNSASVDFIEAPVS
ncbi:hypothetical protein J4G43_030195 [Bradyrhizobium barranii subsp. barranii]|uniref:Uncharacterized protein n=1 Tax=Bradyrhizobium barranii subsp. barranii TaxID=2823807 RepID=A0A939S3A8_9BRAD|nr:hypothetical protein [Bradyrhizobium barranii]UEM09011.1 hypothetical protein J4G43_030195 [Bradyrhizobium barranii subsp. barranii]